MADLDAAIALSDYRLLELSRRRTGNLKLQELSDEEGEEGESVNEASGDFLFEEPITHAHNDTIPSTSYMRCRETVREFMDSKNSSTCAIILQLFLVGVISISVVELILSTVKELKHEFADLFSYIEWGSFAVFSIEIAFRIWVTDQFWFSTVSNIVDTLALLPQILEVAIWLWWHYEEVLRHRESHFLRGLRILQAVRMMRLLRVLTFAKAARHSETLSAILESIWATRSDILLSVTCLVMSCVFTATLMYAVESSSLDTAFVSIPACIWWAIVTLSTVGYGDMVPASPIGKFIALLTMLLGTALTAVSVAAITTAFMEHYQERITRRNFKRAIVRNATTDKQKSPTLSPRRQFDLEERLHKAEESVTAMLTELTNTILSLDTMTSEMSYRNQANVLSENEYSLMAAHALQDQSQNFFKAAMRLAQRISQKAG